MSTDKGTWNGFDFLLIFLTGFTGLMGFFSPVARGLLAEGPSIPMILLILSNCFLKDKNPFLFFAVCHH
jgi:hypothetical protein